MADRARKYFRCTDAERKGATGDGVMSQFPLHDNLHDARQARAEGYAGTVSDARLVWLPPGRPLTLPTIALAAI